MIEEGFFCYDECQCQCISDVGGGVGFFYFHHSWLCMLEVIFCCFFFHQTCRRLKGHCKKKFPISRSLDSCVASHASGVMQTHTLQPNARVYTFVSMHAQEKHGQIAPFREVWCSAWLCARGHVMCLDVVGREVKGGGRVYPTAW